MKNIIIYQTEKNIWFCEKKSWECWKYENNLFPIRLLQTLVSNDFLEDLRCMKWVDLMEILLEALNEWNETIYAN